MNTLRYLSAAVAIVSVWAEIPSQGQRAPEKPIAVHLDRVADQHPQNVKTRLVTYKGRTAVEVIDTTPVDVADGIQLVILDTPEFKDGTIEVEVAGEPKQNAESSAPRGFVDMAFRLSTDAKSVPHYEGFYLRPTNGRAEDQVRRNHATQYISYPIGPGLNCARTTRANTKAMPIWSPANGSTCGSRSTVRKPTCSSMTRPNRF